MKELKDYEKRILEFDPSEIYSRVKVDVYKRSQSISLSVLFPKKQGICSCGCNEKLTGRKTRWATEHCQWFAISVFGIINGRSDTISQFLKILFPNWACCNCGVMDIYKEYKNGMAVNAIHKDHIVAVINGGGGCWLDNYQLLCEDCHKNKTKTDLKKI